MLEISKRRGHLFEKIVSEVEHAQSLEIADRRGHFGQRIVRQHERLEIRGVADKVRNDAKLLLPQIQVRSWR